LDTESGAGGESKDAQAQEDSLAADARVEAEIAQLRQAIEDKWRAAAEATSTSTDPVVPALSSARSAVQTEDDRSARSMTARSQFSETMGVALVSD